MKALRAFAFILISAIFVFSCTKKEEDNEPPQNKTTLLTSSDWKMSNQVASPPFDTLDIWISVDDCIKDNVFSFEKNGNGMMDEKAKLCEPSDDQFNPLLWTFENDEKDLQWVINDDTTLIRDVVITPDSFYGNQVSIFFDYITVTYRAN